MSAWEYLTDRLYVEVDAAGVVVLAALALGGALALYLFLKGRTRLLP